MKPSCPVKLQSLSDYIKDSYDGNKSAFARSQGVSRSHVTQWLKIGYIVIEGNMYLRRRTLQ